MIQTFQHYTPKLRHSRGTIKNYNLSSKETNNMGLEDMFSDLRNACYAITPCSAEAPLWVLEIQDAN